MRIDGRRTKPWGHPGADCGLRLRTAGLDAIVEHNAGDFTAILQPGVTLRELDEALAPAGQMLALDPPLGAGDAATVGGAIAAARLRPAAPPLRRAARPRARASRSRCRTARSRKAGGKVIKNVAGYDLAKLFAGSFGTLGLICEVAVRLHPRPRAQATAIGRQRRPRAARARREPRSRTARSRLQSLDVRWDAARPGRGATRASAASPRRSRR